MSKANVLVVEDSFIVAYHLQSTLESEGFVVLGKCDSGEAAIEFVKHSKPDIVLMDIMLTGSMDGIQTATELKSRFDIPVIYITALTDKETINRAKITEPYGYLTKPFEDRDIFTVLEMALYKHRIESKLKESEEKYFRTVSCISDAVLTINKDYAISFMNPSASEITGWPPIEAIGQPITSVLPLRSVETEEIGVNPLQCSIGMGSLNRLPDNLVLLTKQKKEIPIGESSLSPLVDASGSNVGMILVFKDMTKEKERELLILEMALQRKIAIIEGQEYERARIAKDLHDGLGQMLNAVKINVNLIVTDQKASSTISGLLDEAIQESVRISENLLPSKLRDFDLSTCLKSLCNQTSSSTHYQINYFAGTNHRGLSQSKKINLYRIAQEAITNSIRHAKPRTITVQLNSTPEVLRLSIEDDGGGLNIDSNKRQNGIVNMRDRAEILGGKLTIESDPRLGTIVIAEIPLKKSMTND